MAKIADDEMKQVMTRSKNYCVVILKSGPHRWDPGVEKIVWEHARRNFELRADGILSIVCPVTDSGDVRGIGIFNSGIEEVKTLMDDDPGVKAGVFVYEVHPCRGFPGDGLPK